MEKYQFQPIEAALIERSCIPLAIYQFIDRRVVTLLLSEGFLKLFGYTRAEAYPLMDNDMYRDTHPDDKARIAEAAFRFATEDSGYNVVYRTKRESGYRIIHAFGEHKLVSDGTRVAVVWYNDEGEYSASGESEGTGGLLELSFSRALHQESILKTNYYDALTGLPSMSYFFILAEAGFERMRAEGFRPAIAFFDLIGMKYYNNEHGFHMGDKLIAGFAQLLARLFTNENCSRFAADHFVVFTEEQNLPDKLRRVFDEAAKLNGGNSLSVRAGIYPDRLGKVEISTACDRAKYACSFCQGYSSGYRVFDASMLQHVQKHRYIVNNLERALRERWFRVCYQPIIRTANGRVCNEEALVRWAGPPEGDVGTGELIRILEKAGQIHRLDLYVLGEILEKQSRQRFAGLYIVPHSLNISRADFDACDIVEEIRRRVDEAGIPREKIVIELTESMVGRDFEFMKQQIQRFRELGFQVWMDDFGSGYSSLDVLQSIHFDLIKLDMRFLQQFEKENSRIILTELVKMALALGIETVAEGVETAEQAAFLHDIGCTKLQGFFYCRAIPLEEIVERNRKGIQIGFENPDETPYYAAIGRINLYDLSAVFGDTRDTLDRFLEKQPMAIAEADGEGFRFLHGNKSYRERLEPLFEYLAIGRHTDFTELEHGPGSALAKAMRECRESGKRVFYDEELPDGSTAHVICRHIAVNPVSGVYACVLVMLGVTDAKDRRVTYTGVAQALSVDYIYLYYVNLETDAFIEYAAGNEQEDLNIERHGRSFFATARKDAKKALWHEDVDRFTESFHKEKILRSIDQTGAFTLCYRLMIDGKPQYVSMKAVRIGRDEKHIIIGVNNIDAQMRRQQMLDRIQQEQITYSRITALAGDFLCIYTIDPETNRFTVYTATGEYAALSLPTRGEDFFAACGRNCECFVHPDDRERFRAAITRQNVLQQIRQNGVFSFEHKMLLGDSSRYVRVNAALVEEQDGPQLLVGVIDIDRQRGKPQERPDINTAQ